MQRNVAQRVQKHRIHLRALGLRPVQIWVPDVRQPTFAQECLRQTSLAARSDGMDAVADEWMDSALANVDGWTT
jgi:hypothetical protein